MADKLTPKQALFVEEYLVDLNAAGAARRAKYSPKRCAEKGYALLRLPKVARAIAARRKLLAERTRITPERVLQEYGRIGFSDIRKVFRADGSLVPVTELDDNTAATVASIEVISQRAENEAEVAFLNKIKLWDKIRALDSAARHLGMFDKDKLAVTGANGGPIQTESHFNWDMIQDRVDAACGDSAADSDQSA